MPYVVAGANDYLFGGARWIPPVQLQFIHAGVTSPARNWALEYHVANFAGL